MNDITKARVYLSKRGSKLQTLETFGLMYLTAERDYKDVRSRGASQAGQLPGDYDVKEIEAALDYSVMLFLRRHSVLPANIASAFVPDITKEDKRELAKQWANA